MVCQNQMNWCNGLTSTVSESRGGLLSTARKRSWRVDSSWSPSSTPHGSSIPQFPTQSCKKFAHEYPEYPHLASWLSLLRELVHAAASLPRRWLITLHRHADVKHHNNIDICQGCGSNLESVNKVIYSRIDSTIDSIIDSIIYSHSKNKSDQ